MTDILTKADIVKGKQNLDALDKFMSGSATETVALPGGGTSPTRARAIAEIKSDFPKDTAALRSVGTGPNNVMEVGAFGLGSNASTVPNASETPTSYQPCGFYRHGSESTHAPSHHLSGDASITTGWGNGYFSQLFFSRAGGGRLSFISYSNYETVGWRDIYHEGNSKPYSTTTATSANVVVTATGELQRSTSSKFFKKDIKDIDIKDYRAALKAVRPISYRSTEDTADNPSYSWYSFIAEELMQLDPRLVQLANVEFYHDTDEDGNQVTLTRELPEGKYAPQGINTNAIVALQTKIMQLMLADIEALEKDKTAIKTRLTKIEQRLTALEK